MPKAVFTNVLIVGRLGVDGQSFAPIGLHKTDTASDWLLIKRRCIGTKGLPGVQLKNLSANIAGSVILALTGKKMLLVIQNQSSLRKVPKPAPALIKA